MHTRESETPVSKARAKGIGDRFVVVWSVALALGTAVATVHPEFESDPFWHLTLARSVIEHKSRTVPEPAALSAFTDPAVVPEWLWGVVTLGLGAPGGMGAAIFIVVLTIASVLGISALLRTAAEDLPRGAFAAISGGLSVLLLLRLRLRPETAALVLLPAFLVLAYRYARSSGPQRRRTGGILVALEILWAQVHGSFVIAPVIWAILALGPARTDWKNLSERRTHLSVFAALILGLSTSAYGFGLLPYLLEHAGGDAPKHIIDFAPLRWADFAPSTWLDGPYGGPYAPVIFGMGVVALLGMVIGRRIHGVEVALATLGIALATQGCRFMTMASILAAPLAAKSAVTVAELVPANRWTQFVGVVLGTGLVLLQVRGLHLARGPIGKLGLSEENYPLTAAGYLRQLPEQSIAVLTNYESGAPLGYWLRGKVRTFVDSRTPLYFDATDFAVSRDVFADIFVLRNVMDRYGIQAVVMSRHSAPCVELAEQWIAVVVEPQFTTFVPKANGRPLTSLAPCGAEYLHKNSCQDGGATLDADISRLESWGAHSFHHYLRAERALRCGGPLVDLTTIPSTQASSSYQGPRDRAVAALLLRAGRENEAIEALTPTIVNGDALSFAMAYHTISSERFPVETVRSLLEAVVETQGDRTPRQVRTLLALTCAEQEDAECARFHAFRAAAAGAGAVGSTLEWLMKMHPSARVRADARAWRDLLRARADAQPKIVPLGPAFSAVPSNSASSVPSIAPSASASTGPALNSRDVFEQR